jgi:hypothetical protein
MQDVAVVDSIHGELRKPGAGSGKTPKIAANLQRSYETV